MHKEYPGYVKLPHKNDRDDVVRFDFNPKIRSEPGSTRLDGFAIRMFVLKKSIKDDQSEIGIHLRPEEFLDLIEAMKAESESAQRARKELDELN